MSLEVWRRPFASFGPSGARELARASQGEGLFAVAAKEPAPQVEVPTASPQLHGRELWGGALGSWSSRAGGGDRLGWRQDLGGEVDGKFNEWLSLGLGPPGEQPRLGSGLLERRAEGSARRALCRDQGRRPV